MHVVDRTDRILLILTRLVVLPGFFAATYLSYTRVFDEKIVCGGGCEAVSTSQWSEVFGIPVTYIGMVAYITIMAATFIKGDNGKLLAAFTASCGAAFSLFLQYQSLIVLKHLCPYCFTSAICMLILCGLTITRLLRLPKVDAAAFDDETDSDVELGKGATTA
jgi:uncharacterized membrane protein